jgi:hypothetical protein
MMEEWGGEAGWLGLVGLSHLDAEHNAKYANVTTTGNKHRIVRRRRRRRS